MQAYRFPPFCRSWKAYLDIEHLPWTFDAYTTTERSHIGKSVALRPQVLRAYPFCGCDWGKANAGESDFANFWQSFFGNFETCSIFAGQVFRTAKNHPCGRRTKACKSAPCSTQATVHTHTLHRASPQGQLLRLSTNMFRHIKSTHEASHQVWAGHIGIRPLRIHRKY